MEVIYALFAIGVDHLDIADNGEVGYRAADETRYELSVSLWHKDTHTMTEHQFNGEDVRVLLETALAELSQRYRLVS